MDIEVVIDMHLHNAIIDDFSKYVRSPSCVSKCFECPIIKITITTATWMVMTAATFITV